jgi:hypothetical protein
MNTLILNHVASRDAQGMHFKAGSWDITTNTLPKGKPLSDADAARIIDGLKDLHIRLSRIEGGGTFRAATKGPGMTPRTLNPQEAYQAHLTAYAASQAKRSQRIAHEAGFAPQHPDDAAKEAREQQEVTRDFNPASYEQSLLAAKTHRMIARPGHLTFADRHTLARCAAQTSNLRAQRNYEALLMRDMVHTVAKHLGED